MHGKLRNDVGENQNYADVGTGENTGREVDITNVRALQQQCLGNGS